ncbi:MAG: hypothetical protein AAFU80_04465 [Pseudomonadota bacterium]
MALLGGKRRRRRRRRSRRKEGAPLPLDHTLASAGSAGDDPSAPAGPQVRSDVDTIYQEERARRRRMAQRARRLRLWSWWVVVVVALGFLVADVAQTTRCTLPLPMEYARIRVIWHADWAVSLALTLPLTLFCISRLREVWLARATIAAYAVWKGAVLLRDRIAVPACPDGWTDARFDRYGEWVLSLGSATAFVLFITLLWIAAHARRRVS